MRSLRRGPGSRPGRGPSRSGSEAGAVTVEAALSLLAMVGVVAALVWGMSLLGAQLQVAEASRAAARAAARGDSYALVADEARRLVPGAAVDVRSVGGRVEVEVVGTVVPPGAFARLGPVRLASVAVAAREGVMSP